MSSFRAILLQFFNSNAKCLSVMAITYRLSFLLRTLTVLYFYSDIQNYIFQTLSIFTGYAHHYRYGFGLLDVTRAVNIGKDWPMGKVPKKKIMVSSLKKIIPNDAGWLIPSFFPPSFFSTFLFLSSSFLLPFPPLIFRFFRVYHIPKKAESCLGACIYLTIILSGRHY